VKQLAMSVPATHRRPRQASSMTIWRASVICQEHGTRVLPRPRDHRLAAGLSWGS
jgi:hypothetical protein